MFACIHVLGKCNISVMIVFVLGSDTVNGNAEFIGKLECFTSLYQHRLEWYIIVCSQHAMQSWLYRLGRQSHQGLVSFMFAPGMNRWMKD